MGQPQHQPQAPRVPVPPPGSDERVSVACKMPNGLILRGFRESVETENVLGGGTKDVTYWRPNGEEIVIGGTTVRAGMTPPILINGYRVTRGVPKKLWDQWYEANKNSDLVKNHLIFAHSSDDHIQGFSRDHAAARTGLEGVNPDRPSDHVRNIQRNERKN